MPWGHLAAGYVCYSLGLRTATDESPSDVSALVLAFATQFPDLVDKPLDVLLPVLEGRSFMHSFVFVVPLCVAVLYAAERRGRLDLGATFSFGVLAHLAGDAVDPLLYWGPFGARFLVWPLLPAPYYPTGSLREYVGLLLWHLEEVFASGHLVTTLLSTQFLLLAGCVVLWVRDGYPGLGLLVPERRGH